MNPFRQKANGSHILVQERGDSGQRDRGSSVWIIAQVPAWASIGHGEAPRGRRAGYCGSRIFIVANSIPCYLLMGGGLTCDG